MRQSSFLGCLALAWLSACSIQRSGTGPDHEEAGLAHTGGATGTGGAPATGGAGGSGDTGGDTGGSGGSVTGGGGSGGSSDSGGALADQYSEPAPCTAFPDAQAYGGHCYFAPSGTATWSDARAACQSDGGDLATLTSAAEDAWVTSTFAAPTNWFWIGLTDGQAITSTNITAPYGWASGEAMTYTNWAMPESGVQPDHFCGAGECGATCCQHRGIIGSDGTWFDRADSDLNPYLCEAVP